MGNLMDERRRIIAAQPHLASAFAETQTCVFVEPKIEYLRLYFTPRYDGTGTPSGSNKYSISRWYGLSVHVGNKLFSKSLSDAGYGGALNGYYDLVTGAFVSNWSANTATASSSISSYSNRGSSSIFWVYASGVKVYNSQDVTLLSNMFTWTGSHYNYDTVPDWSFAGSSSYKNSYWVKVPNSVLPALSLDGAKTWVGSNNITVIGPSASPISVNIGEISDLEADRGSQIVSSANSFGTVMFSLTYWTH